MIPYNCTLLDALRYHRDLVTDDDIVVEVERLNSIVDVVEDKIDFDSPSELSAVLDQKQELADNTDTLVIPGVDFDLLEQQRQMLYALLDRLNTTEVSAEELEALTGVLNMLDSWSDKR